MLSPTRLSVRFFRGDLNLNGAPGLYQKWEQSREFLKSPIV